RHRRAGVLARRARPAQPDARAPEAGGGGRAARAGPLAGAGQGERRGLARPHRLPALTRPQHLHVTEELDEARVAELVRDRLALRRQRAAARVEVAEHRAAPAVAALAVPDQA